MEQISKELNIVLNKTALALTLSRQNLIHSVSSKVS